MDIQDIRRANLQAMVDAQGLSTVAKKFKKPDRQIKDMLEKRKSFGEKVARDMEENYDPHMPLGWLDKSEITIRDSHDLLRILGFTRETLGLPQIERVRAFVRETEELQIQALAFLKKIKASTDEKSYSHDKRLKDNRTNDYIPNYSGPERRVLKDRRGFNPSLSRGGVQPPLENGPQSTNK